MDHRQCWPGARCTYAKCSYLGEASPRFFGDYLDRAANPGESAGLSASAAAHGSSAVSDLWGPSARSLRCPLLVLAIACIGATTVAHAFLDAQCVPHVLFLLALTVLHLFLAPCCRGLLLLNVFGRRLKPE